MNRFVIANAAVMLLVSISSGQQSYPMVMSIEPVAAQVGTSSEHVVKSRYSMQDAYQVLVSGEGVVGEVVVPKSEEEEKKSGALESLSIRFTVQPDAIPGVRDFRIATPRGISTTGQLVVARDPILEESGDNHSMADANVVSLPATLCGKIEKAEDVDLFRFHADAGDSIAFHVRCMRLQDRIHDLQQHADPLITLRHASGTTLAAADNVFAADPLLVYSFRESGDYFLEIRDVRYQGNRYWTYCIEASNRPFVQTVFPLAIDKQGSQTLELVGQALGQISEGQLRLDDQNPALGIRQALVSVQGSGPQPIEVIVTDQLLQQEQAGVENDSHQSAQLMTVPCGVNGRIERPTDIDYYQFEAKQGQKYTFEVMANRVGSSLDPHLRILDANGTQQQLNDDLRSGKRTFADSMIENWKVPADGKYLIEVRDVNLRGGASYVYFLSVTKADPHFLLFADTDKTPLTPGTSGIIYVRAEKKNGFDQDIQLQVDGLPDGVTATCGKILAGKSQDGCVVLTSALDSKPTAQRIRISGISMIDQSEQADRPETGNQLTAEAVIYQEIYQPGGGRGHWPVNAHVVSVGYPGDVRKVSLSTYDLKLQPGQSATIDVEIERAEGFDENVTLEVIYKHLNSVYGNPLPEGVSVDKAASKVLLTGGATTGKITLKAADNAPPATKQIFSVMANVSINFVMKATYASDPVSITVGQ